MQNPEYKTSPAGQFTRWLAGGGLAAASFVFLLMQGCFSGQCPEGLVCEKDITYGMSYIAGEGDAPTLQSVLMDVIQPEDEASVSRPAVILIHGGGFESGSKEDEHHRETAIYLAQRGYVCFLINYRLMGDNPPAPETYTDVMSKAVHAAVVDAKTALRHVHANSQSYQVDTRKIALLGDSAGAITALAAGLSGNDRFGNDGPDYPVPPENNPGVAARAAAIVNLWGSADFFPELFAPGAPPIMTVHGGRDFTVGVSLLPALNIDQWCEENGITHVFYPLPEAGHGAWDADIEGKSLSEAIAQFLNTHMNVPGKTFASLGWECLSVLKGCRWLEVF